MNSGRRIYRVLVVLTALAMLASCVPVPITPIPPTPGSPGVADLIAQLADQDAGVRLRAAYQLGELWPTDADAVNALIQAAGDPDSQVRTVATYALGKTRQATGQAVFTLVNRLIDDSPQVRYSAARALGNLGEPAKAVQDRLLDRLSLKNEADENVRYAVAEAIAKIGPGSNALSALMEALTDDNWYVRHYAELALQQFGVEALVASLEFHSGGWGLRSRVTDLLSQRSQKEIPGLVSVLLDRNTLPDVRALVVVALIRMAPESTPFLIAALIDPDNNFPVDTATALAGIGPDAIPELVGVLRSGNEQAAGGAADALAQIGDPAIPHVLPLLKDEDADDAVRLAAVQLLGSIGKAANGEVAQLAASLVPADAEKWQAAIARLHEIEGRQDEAVRALVSTLQSGKPAIRPAAADSLAQFGAAARPAVPALVQALRDGDGEVRVAAARALGSLGSGSRAAFAALVTASQDQGSTALRTEAIKALGAIGAQAAAALPELIEAAKNPDDAAVSQAAIEAIGKMGPAAYPAVGALAVILQSGQQSQRLLAAQALGGVGPAAVLELITALQREQDGDVRSAVETSLKKIGPSAVPALVEVLGGGEPSAAEGARDALIRMGGTAVSSLIIAYRTADTTMRAKILNIFQDIGPRAFAGFEVALQDENKEIRAQAATAATEVFATEDIKDGLVVLVVLKPPDFLTASGLAVKEAVPFLASAIVAEERETRLQAVRILAYIGPNAAEAVPALIDALKDKDQCVRLDAAEALEEKHQCIRFSAAKALEAIGPLAAEAAPALGGVLRDTSTDPDVRGAAARALAAIGPQAATAAPALVAALQHETDLETRRSMIEALAVAGPSVPGGIQVLVEALRDPALRRTASEALGHAGADAAPDILDFFKQRDQTTPFELAEALHGTDNDLRRSAAYALLLNAAATRSISDDLVAVLGDEIEDASVRSMVAAALEASGRNVASFWSGQGADSPLGKTCPLGEGNLSGGSSFDIYYDGCNYSPGGTQLPSLSEIVGELIDKLTGR